MWVRLAMSGASGERSVAASAGGAKPIAGVGWVGGAHPSAQIQGADSGFRRTNGIHPRRAKRRAQVCGEDTVKGNGQGNNKFRRLCWHLIHR